MRLTQETNNWADAHKTGLGDAHVEPYDLAEAICQKIIYKKKAIVFNGPSSKFNVSLRSAGSA